MDMEELLRARWPREGAYDRELPVLIDTAQPVRGSVRAQGGSPIGWNARALAFGLVLTLVAGIALYGAWRLGQPTVAGPTATPTSTLEPRTSGSASVGPTQPIASPTATIDPQPTPTPTPTANGTYPSLPAVPAGNWTGLDWFTVPTGALPPALGTYGPGGFIDLFGWSRGYVDFVWDGDHSVVPWASADGLHWQAGPKLPPGDLPYTLPTISPDIDSWCDFEIDSFVEGPAGLLAHGAVVCQGASSELPRSRPYSATWASADGLNWSVAGEIPDGELAVGTSGFMVTDGQRVWTSPDARTWVEGVAPTAALPKGSRWGHLVAVEGGFVMGPETPYAQWPLGGNFPDGTAASIVWSPDGKTWTRTNPPGAKSGLTEIWIDKLSQGLVLLREETWSDAAKAFSMKAWTSLDGRTWKLLATWNYGAPEMPFVTVQGVQVPNSGVVSLGGHAILGHIDQGQDTLAGFDAGARRLIPLSNTGEADWPSISLSIGHQMALGPAGLLVADTQGGLIIAVPTAG